ncbi:lipid phosphate phosphatase 3, chloroplastic [Paraphaeosphaeria sporulosa]
MAFAQNTRSIFSRTSISYLLDWLVIVIFLGIAGAFSFVEPIKRDFSLTDKSISFPYRKDTISIPLLFVVAVIAPAVMIAAICGVLVRLPSRPGPVPSRSAIWKRKLWELHAAWLGLALSLTLSLFLTQTMKNMFGKHRPDFLARCNPDISKMSHYIVGGYTSEILEGTSQLVRWEICLNKDGGRVSKSEFIDGFRSFPSGHCTVAFAGLIYLSLFLAAKSSAAIPFLPPLSKDAFHPKRTLQERRKAAAPPLYLLAITLTPIAAAIYIASTRYTDDKHAGFDVLFGSLEGLICAWFAFRYYHLPIRRGAGWAWGPRHWSAAFGIGMGVGSYGTSIHSEGKQRQGYDIESGVNAGGHIANVELHDLEPAGAAGRSYESQRALV